MLEMRDIADPMQILDRILEPTYGLKLNYTINALHWRSTFQLWSNSLKGQKGFVRYMLISAYICLYEAHRQNGIRYTVRSVRKDIRPQILGNRNNNYF
jgi:hypothetical protein